MFNYLERTVSFLFETAGVSDTLPTKTRKEKVGARIGECNNIVDIIEKKTHFFFSNFSFYCLGKNSHLSKEDYTLINPNQIYFFLAKLVTTKASSPQVLKHFMINKWISENSLNWLLASRKNCCHTIVNRGKWFWSPKKFCVVCSCSPFSALAMHKPNELLFIFDCATKQQKRFGNVIYLFCTTVRQKIVRGRGSSNINLRLFVFAPLMFLRFITTFPFINYAHA